MSFRRGAASRNKHSKHGLTLKPLYVACYCESMVKNHLSECQLIQIGFDESSINLDKLQESKGAPYCEECAENHIVTQAEQMLYGSPLCYDCFTEFQG